MGCGCGGGGRRGRRISTNQRNRTLKPNGVKQKNNRTADKPKAVKGVSSSNSPVDRAKKRVNQLRREAIRRAFGR